MYITLRKLHTRPAMTWAAVSTFIRSHQQALGNLINLWTPVGFELSISVAKLIHFSTCVTVSRSYMVPGANKVPQLRYYLTSSMFGSIQATGIVTRACRPSGTNLTHHREPLHPSFVSNVAYIDGTYVVLLYGLRLGQLLMHPFAITITGAATDCFICNLHLEIKAWCADTPSLDG